MPVVSAANLPYTPVPSVEPDVRAPQAFQDMRATPGAFGGSVAEATSQLGRGIERGSDVLAEGAIRQQELFNQVAADNASNQWQDATNKMLFGDPAKGDTGFYGKHGRDALDDFPRVRDQIDRHLQATRATLQNPRQQLQFDNETRRMRSFLMNEVGRHYDQQFQAFAVDTNKASVDSGMRRMATASATDNDAEFQQATGETMRKAIEGVKLKGGGQEMIDDALSKVRSEAVKMRTLDMANKNPLAAQKFLEANTDALAPGEYSTLFREMRVRGEKAQTQEDVGKALRGDAGNLSVGGGIRNVITSAALNTNVDPKLALTTAQIESGMGSNLGSRGNIFQLGKNEWASVGGGSMGEPETDTRNGVAFLADKQREMNLALGRPPEPWETYLAHQQGTGGAISLLTNPDKPAGQVVKPEYIRANGGDPNAPASEFTNRIAAIYQKTADKISPNNAPDTVVGEPKVSHSLPALEPGMSPDSVVPGLKGAIERLDKVVPKDEPERFWRGVQEIRKQYNVEYQDKQRQLRDHQVQVKQQSEARENDYLKRMYPGSPNAPNAQQLLQDEFLTPEAKTKLVGFSNREGAADPAAGVDKSNAVDLFSRMNLPDGDPNKVTTEKPFDEAYVGQQITRTTHDWLVKQFRDARSAGGETLAQRKKELTDAVKTQILGPDFGQETELIDPGRKMRLYGFIENMNQKIEEYQKAGKNPNDLFNPKSQDFLGSPEAVKGFSPPMKLSIQDPKQPVATEYNAPEDVAAAVRSGKLSYDAAAQMLITKWPDRYEIKQAPQKMEAPIAR